MRLSLFLCIICHASLALVPVDDRLFLHVLGDVFVENTGLEGNSATITIPYRTKVLEEIQAEGDVAIQDLIHQNKNAEELMYVFAHGLADFRNTLLKQLDKLQPGESLFLPASWTKHAILYQITKQADGLYTLKIFNSGEGIAAYHAKTTQRYQTQYFPFVELVDIKKDKITSFIFLKELQKIASPGVYKSKPEDVYEKLLWLLDGKPSPVVYDASVLKDPQLSGTCSYFSTPWLMSSTVGEKVGARIEYLIGLKTLQSFATQKRNWDESSLNLLRKGLVFFSQSAARKYRDGYIDDKDLARLAYEGEQVQQIIFDAERQIERIQGRDASRFAANNVMEMRLPSLDTNLARAQNIYAGVIHREAASPVFDLNDDLGELYNQFKNHINDKLQAELVATAIEELALKLPLHEAEWAFKDHAKTIQSLADISKLYLFILLKQVQNGKRDPDKVYPISYLTTLKLLTVADLINQELIYGIKPKIPSMVQPRAVLILSGNTAVFDVSDPRWQYQMELMRKYYKPHEKQGESFFGFEQFPVGVQEESRYFYDDKLAIDILNEHNKKFFNIQRQYEWPDFKWAKNWIADNHIKTTYYYPTRDAYYDHVSYMCHGVDSSYRTAIKEYIHSSLDNSWFYEVIERFISAAHSIYKPCAYDCLTVDTYRGTDEILLNRKTIHALAGNDLPDIFYQLRDLSAVTDFLLTGRLGSNPQNLHLESGVSVQYSLEQIKHSAPTQKCTCSCLNKGLGPVFVDELTRYKKFVDKLGPWGDESFLERASAVARAMSALVGTYILNTWYPVLALAFHLELPKEEPAWEVAHFNLYRLQYKIFGASFERAMYEKYFFLEPTEKKGHYLKPWVNLRESDPFYAVKEALLPQIWSYGENFPMRFRLEPNEYILQKPLADWSLERMRNLLGINSKTQLQLKSTLDFFTKYPELFSRPDYQVLFEKLMMEPGLMMDQLRISEHDSALFIRGLKAFCDEKLQLFKQYGNEQGFVFTLRMMHLFHEQIAFVQTLSDGKVSKNLENTFAGVPEKLFQMKQYQEVAKLFANSAKLSERDVQLLLFSVVYSKSNNDVLVKQHANIQPYFNRVEKRNWILNFVAGKSGDWVKSGDIYSLGNWQIDIVSGQVYEGGNPEVIFPSNAFKGIFAETQHFPEHAIQTGLDSYEWTFDDGVKAKAKKVDAVWFYQQQIDGKWYEYVPSAALAKLGQTRLVMSAYQYWQHDQSDLKMIDPKTNKVVYEAELNGGTIKSLRRLVDGAVLVDVASGSAYRVFEQIEDWKHIYVWLNPTTNRVIEVDLPRLKLNFKAYDNQMNCAENAGYQIAQLQYVPELGSPINYLVCERKKYPNQKLILMPAVRPVAPETTLDSKFSVKFENASEILVYKTDPLLGLQKTSEASRYYLALRQLFKRQYRQAAETIRDTSIELEPLEGNAQKIVKWLIEGDEKDHDPRSYAVRVLAVYWQKKQAEYYSGPLHDYNKVVALYRKYLAVMKHLDLSILGTEEKKKVAWYLDVPDGFSESYDSKPIFINSKIERKSENPEDWFTVENRVREIMQKGEGASALVYHFDLLRRVLTRNSFVRHDAESLLKEFLATDVSNLTDDELRTELAQIVRLSSLSDDKIGRYLESLAEESGILSNFRLSPKAQIKPNSHRSLPEQLKPIIPETPADIASADLPLASVAMEDPLRRPLFSEAQLRSAVKIRRFDTFEVEQIHHEAKLLGEVLNQSQNEAVQELKGQILNEAWRLENTERFYEKVDWEQFHAPDVTAQQAELKKLHTQILKDGQRYANPFNQVLHFADVGKKIQLDDLIYVLLKRNFVALYATQGALNLNELTSLYQNLIRYLMLSTYLDHVSRFQAAIDVARSCKQIHSDECQIKIANVVSLATTVRNYSIASHIEYLVFEYFMKILIRDEQVKTLNQLQIKGGQIHNQKALGGVIEMIMGSGKTSVVLPLLSALEQPGKWINMVVLPKALLQRTAKDLSEQLGTAFKRNVWVMDISRQRYLKVEDLQVLYKRLLKTREQGQTVVTTNSAIQSLFLSFIDRLATKKSGVTEFIQIFNLLRESGRLTIDEVDLAFDVLQSHHFSVGAAIPLIDSPTLKILPIVAFSLYREIATDPGLYQELDFPFMHHRGRIPFTRQAYEQFKPKLVDAILKPGFLRVYPEFSRRYDAFIQSDREAAKNYILTRQGPVWDPQIREILSVLSDEINQFLPLTAIRKIGVHYGALTGHEFAVPYHSGEPMPNSRFGTALENLNYSLQLAIHEKGYRRSLEKEIQFLKQLVYKQNNLSLLKTRLSELACHGSLPSSLIKINQHDIDRLFNEIQNQPSCLSEQLNLDWRYVVPKIKFHEKQISTNAQVYESLFAYIQGFSGTLWSSQTFPHVFKQPVLSNTAEKTFLILWRDYLKDQKPVLRVNNLSQIYEGFDGSLIDEAGLFRQSENIDIAKWMRAKTHHDVAFYDEENNLLSLGTQIKVLENKKPEWDLIAFWDKKHTTGSDIKLWPYMTAAMTFDMHLTSRNLQQAVWRLRGLGTGQKVTRYAATDIDINIIKERLKSEWHVTPSSRLNLGDVILYSVLNEDSQLKKLKLKASRQKEKNVEISKFLNYVFGETKLNDVYWYYDVRRSLFELTSNQEDGIEVNVEHEQEQEKEKEQEKEQEKQQEQEVIPYQFGGEPEKPRDWNLGPKSFSDPFWVPQERDNGSILFRFDHVRAPVVRFNKVTEGHHPIFSTVNNHILISLNFADFNSDRVSDLFRFHLYETYFKPMNDLLVVQNKTSGEFKLIFIDDHDAKIWDDFLRGYHGHGGENRIALYNLSTNRIFREGPDPINEHDIPKDLLVQAGFLSGRVNYPREELPALKAFLERAGPRKMEDVFKSEILKWKKETRKAYRGSDIEKIFLHLFDNSASEL